jgi:hypothetical protein
MGASWLPPRHRWLQSFSKVGKIYFCNVFAEQKFQEKNGALGRFIKTILSDPQVQKRHCFHLLLSATVEKTPPLLIYKLANTRMTEAVDILADTRLEYWNIGIYCRNENI